MKQNLTELEGKKREMYNAIIVGDFNNHLSEFEGKKTYKQKIQRPEQPYQST